MLCAAGAFMRVGKKTFILNLHSLIDTQGRGAQSPESAALSGYLHITSNYITVRLVSADNLELHTEPKTSRPV